jgi:hypothetical protein
MPLFPRGSVTASWGPCIRLRLHQAHTSALQLRFYQREGLQVRARGRAALGLGARTPAKAALALAQHQLPIVHTISTNERKARVRGCLCAENKLLHAGPCRVVNRLACQPPARTELSSGAIPKTAGSGAGVRGFVGAQQEAKLCGATATTTKDTEV